MSARATAGNAGREAAPDWISRSAEETERAGEALAPALESGDLIVLQGPLGAGKTRFVAGLARGLGYAGAVKSPTFTLIHEYAARLVLFHGDLYRVSEPDALALGFEESLERGVVVVEWGEKLPASWAREALGIEITLRDGDERTLTASAEGATRAAVLLARWRAAVRSLGGAQ